MSVPTHLPAGRSRAGIGGDRTTPYPADPTSFPGQPVPSRTTRVLVVDDHPIARAGVVSLLSSHDWLKVVGQAADGQEAMEKARSLCPDLAVVDINLPRLSGLVLTRNLKAELPPIRVLILSMHNFDEVCGAVVECGASGYVCKRLATEGLIQALELVASGKTYFPRAAGTGSARSASPDHVQGNRPEISPREREVLIGIAEGLSNKEVADRLGLGVRTIETHRGALMRKLNIRNVAGLTRFAVQSGLIASISA